MAVNKRQYNFNKNRDKTIFNTSIGYKESYIKQILYNCGMTITFIKNTKEHNMDEILFRDKYFIYYNLVQDIPELGKNLFHITLWSKNINISNKVLGQIKGVTEENIKKLVKKIKPEKYIEYINIKELLKEYKSIVDVIERQGGIGHIIADNGVLPQSEIDSLLSSISSK